MKKIFFLLICVYGSLLTTQAQDQHIVDSLLNIVKITPDDTNKVNNLLAVGDEYEHNQPVKAAGYYKQALDVAQLINNPLYKGKCFEYLGLLYGQGLAKYDTSKVYFLKCLEVRKEVLGEKHILYAASLNNLAVLYDIMGNYFAAEPLYLEAMKIRKEVMGEKHPDYAESLNNLALLYYNLGNYSAALPLWIEANNINKEALGEKNSAYAISLCNLAGLYKAMGNYPAAEPLYLAAKNIRKEVLGEKHPDYATSLNNLALLYICMGNYTDAEHLLLEAKNINKEVLGEKHPDYALSLNNLAGLYKTMGNYPAAEPLYLEANNIYKEVLGEKHPWYAQSLNNLAVLYEAMGNYAAAEPLNLEGKNIYKEVLGEKHPWYAQSLSNLAELYKEMGNNSAAEPLYIEAKNIRKEVLGEKHPDYAQSLMSLAGLYLDMGNNKKAESFYIEYMNISLENIKQNFSFLSEKEKEDYIKTLSGYFNNFSSFAFKRYKENPLIAQNLYNINLATKGLLLSSSNRIRDEINSSSDTVLVNQYKKWLVLKEEIGRYDQWSKAKLIKMNIKLDSLKTLANTMEKQISLKSNAFSNDRKNNDILWNQVREKLNDMDAAVEFITYQTINLKSKKKSDTTIYCALVLRKEDKYPQMLALCNNFELATMLGKTELYKTTAQVKGIKPIVSTYVDDETESQVLYNLIWKPLDTLLIGKEKIYVSITGLLNKISFDALQDDKKQLLLNKYNLCFVNSTRQLATEEITNVEENKTIALFGGVNYDLDTTQIKNKTNEIYASRGLSSDTLQGNKWNYLSGTLTEVDNIDKIFLKKKWNTKVYTGSDATEEAFKAFSGKNSPSILHISTHGFFYPEPDSTTYKTTRNPFKTMLNPLWRSGIILAGANYAWQCKPVLEGKEDGILTAYEVANSNLKNTDLVVLSACETGLGDIKTGEGVYGLQRAFQVAGAKAVIMSLWQVPDKETTELMTLFYENYIKTKNKHDSFRNAQQTMSKKYAPYYWAAFVLVE